MRLSWRARMNALHIWQKLLILGAVFALLFAIPTSLYFGEVAEELARTSREIDGLIREDGLQFRCQCFDPALAHLKVDPTVLPRRT